MNRWLGTIVLAGALVAGSLPASACKGSKILFSDDFQEVDASWGLDAPDVVIEDNKVKVKPQPNISNLLIYKGLVFSDADFCLTVRMPNVVANNDNTMAGPVFWQQDYDNYYMFMITPSGYAEIARKLNGKWLSVIDWRADSDIKLTPGSNNVLRVLMNGNTITTFINDAKFATVKGQMPDGGGRIGMRAQSEEKQVDTWKFSALKVTDVLPTDASAPAAAADAPAAAAITTPTDPTKTTPAASAAPATPAAPAP